MAKKKSKIKQSDDAGNSIKPGETIRFMCDDCNVEFEVCLEPKVKDDPDSAEQMEAQELIGCPFCASSSIEPC